MVVGLQSQLPEKLRQEDYTLGLPRLERKLGPACALRENCLKANRGKLHRQLGECSSHTFTSFSAKAHECFISNVKRSEYEEQK